MKADRNSGLSLITPGLEAFVNAHWTVQMGAVDGHDIRFLASLLAESAPKVIVEIGCASGFSTAAIGMMMSERAPCTVHSFDLATHFYADPSKALGYLVSEVDLAAEVKVELHPQTSSLDVGRIMQGQMIDFCFIDARHAHPWPILDTLAVLPYMRPGGVIVHHDLWMYKDSQVNGYATGPKMVLDQTPAELRIWFGSRVYDAPPIAMKTRLIGGGNIFAVKVPENREDLAGNLAQGLYLPWDVLEETYVPAAFQREFAKLLAKHYPAYIGKALRLSLARYNDHVRRSSVGCLRHMVRRLLRAD